MSKSPLNLAKLIRSDMWFADGNIVLICNNVAFKVHQGQLERHSQIFEDLFTVPQPDDEELLEGCPWVELHDTPSDVLYLLRALYDGLYFEQPSSNDFPIIAAVLRLSSKYMIDHLRRRCLLRLRSDWPVTLEAWDTRERIATEDSGRYNPRDAYPHPLLVINLALELDIIDILPTAYYDLSRYGPRRIVSGTPLPPPLLFAPCTSPEPVDTPMDPEFLKLNYEELRVVFLGRESAQRHLAAFIERELASRPISKGCLNKHNDAGRVCRESFYYIMLNVLRAVGGISHGRDADPLYSFAQAVDMLTRTDFSDGEKLCGLKICALCKNELATSVECERKDVWNEIPRWFGIMRGGEEASEIEFSA
ncbi:unnamed protein product [Somion occarium]|uniref:BTB domain-containing protein n=1 Tax=Somion occarium TaxID=3059160 RepID=A0ABP1E813_9APHY